MRTFAPKPKANQPIPSAKSPVPDQDQNSEANSILDLQRNIGNQAVQRMLRINAVGPDKQGGKTDDFLEEVLREAIRNPPPRTPEPTIPNDLIQQAHTIPQIDPEDLWFLPHVQERMKAVAADTEARERAAVMPGGVVTHTADNMMDYWEQRFVNSVGHILYERRGDMRAKLLKELRKKEEKLVESFPAVPPTSSRSPESAEQQFSEQLRVSNLREQVDALRKTYKDKWQQEVDRAVEQYITLASNEAQYLTVSQAAKRVSVYGLPEFLEGTVEATAHPETVGKGSEPVSPSVVRFMKAVQKESGLKALADNYPEHETHNPYLGNKDEVGKYSFDVDLSGLIKVNPDGFYDRKALIEFFMAVNRASESTGIAWFALYNDFEVIKTVNETLGKRRIGFAGGGRGGSTHHGPRPYVLHIHFNIMPRMLAAVYLLGKRRPPNIDL